MADDQHIRGLAASALEAEQREDWAAALELWTQLHAATPDMPDPARHAIAALVRLNRHEEANDVLNRALSRHPADPQLADLRAAIGEVLPQYHYDQGVAAHQRGDYAAAIHHLARASELVPDNPHAWGLLDQARGWHPDFAAVLRDRDGDVPRRRIFILGCARSGTWLAAAMMTCFRDAFVLREEAACGRFARIAAPERTHVMKREAEACETAHLIPAAIDLLYVVRFPLDVLVSPHIDIEHYVDVERWQVEVAALRRLMAARPDGVHIVRYEDLVNRPDWEQTQIADRFGLQAERPFSRFHEGFAIRWRVARAMNGIRPPDRSSIGRWRSTAAYRDYCRRIWPQIEADAMWICETFGYELPDLDAEVEPAPAAAIESRYEPLPIAGIEPSSVVALVSASTWADEVQYLRAETPAPEGHQIKIDEFLSEEHHRYYGRPWIIGRFYVDYLLRRGVDRWHRVLDIGCGAGRVGIWLIPYLEVDRYCGVDVHLRSLVAFSHYESLLHNLAPKRPRLLLSDKFEFDSFETRFDIALDFSVTYHLTAEQGAAAYRNLYQVMQPGGRVFMPHEPPLGIAVMRELGFTLSHTEKTRYPLLDQAEQQINNDDEWHEFTRE